MSMILFAYVARVTDGLPLSASTDFEYSTELQESKMHLKIVSKMLGQFPGRGTVKNNQLHIHFTSSQGVAYMTICCSYYPTTMAYCFLEELGMEFASSFEVAKIQLVSRPYAFLEFDNVIQKIKWHYNHSNRPSLKISVTNIQRELKVTPPRQVNLDDIVISNGTLNGHLHLCSGSAPSYRLEIVSALGILSIILNIVCGALNLIRGVHLIEHNFQDSNEEKGSVVAFLVAFISCAFQCYLYIFYVSARTIKAPVALVLLCICNLYLFGLRNIWQIFFHLGVACLSTQQILSRRMTERLADCGV
ncbi:vesicle-trafficking protein SEC22c [Amblyraja radiata]|uniref:vesicle-trafficking protein SEC22c n=1 Tax=Amblyraja radiata TaxID=386614 RepID=UPI0014037EA8|nr:vesicle-trafficking protein SEC22c [Amblyraja radiata]XP_032899152.1 vesicle-trafficking protein SEC22c [Amblyraja radiata]XP_032899164.1 vesicle-trafficking protein SEC22c [Amblyraja radiata]